MALQFKSHLNERDFLLIFQKNSNEHNKNSNTINSLSKFEFEYYFVDNFPFSNENFVAIVLQFV